MCSRYCIALYRKLSAVPAGASGALCAVIGALVYLVLRKRGDVEEIAGKRLLLMAALSIAQGFARGLELMDMHTSEAFCVACFCRFSS